MADWYFRGGAGKVKTCPGCRNLVKNNEEFCPYCARRLRDENGVWGWIKRTLNQPFAATRFLIGAIAAVFILQMLADLFLPIEYRSSSGGLFSMLTASPVTYIRMGSNFQPFVMVYHEYWRFVTSCFLHFGIFHILFNCWALWDLGRLAERMWGAKQVFAVFIITGIAGAWTSYAWNMHVLGKGVNSAGASGAICGILGLLLGAYYRNKWHVGEMLGSVLIRWAIYILVFGLVLRADNAAHIGGMISGAVFGYFLSPTAHTKTYARDMKIWNSLAGISAVLMVASFVFAAVFYLQGPELVGLLLGGRR